LRIVSKTLRKNKDERYQTMKDLLSDLKAQRSAQSGLSSDEIGSGKVIVEAVLDQQTKKVQSARTTLSAEFPKFPKRKPLFWTAGVLGSLLLMAVGAWFLSRLITTPGPTQPALTAIPLTTDAGFEGMPSLSPDGNLVAFASGGPQTDNFDIYVKQVGGGPPRRLTSDPAVDEFPAWSPDGRSLAFIR